jgi:hypothetical protein
MEVSGQLHDPVALNTGKESTGGPEKWEDGLDAEQVWAL